MNMGLSHGVPGHGIVEMEAVQLHRICHSLEPATNFHCLELKLRSIM